jgi:hypothetical protein
MSIVDGMIPEGEFIKPSEFEEPQTVKFLGVQKIEANDPKFGDEEGKVVEYTLEVDGKTRKLTTNSKRLLFAVQGASIEEGDSAVIARKGTGFDTTWSVEKADGSIPF